MSDQKLDKRIQRTRELLKNALLQLIDEKTYDAITIQDIVERANLGRSTFYLHYESKDGLLLDHHNDFSATMMLRPLTFEEMMGTIPPIEVERFLRILAEHKPMYRAITQAKDADMIMNGVRQQMLEVLSDNLQTIFADKTANCSMELLVNYIIGAHLSLIDWWLTNRNQHSAEDVAKVMHQLQRAAVQSAYGLTA